MYPSKRSGIFVFVKEKIKQRIFDERLGNWLGVLLSVGGGLFYAFVLGRMGFTLGVLLLGAVIGTPLLLASLFYPTFGVYFILTVSYFLLGIKRFIPNVPVGLFTDVMMMTLAFSVFYNNITEKNWDFAKGAISRMVLIYIGYVFITFFNPAAGCKLCFIYTMRSMAGYMLFYFIVSYVLKTKEQVKRLVKLWILLSLLAALYGIKQDLIGLAGFEDRWVHADPKRFWLLFQWGRLRKFSFMADPVTFGFNMGYTQVLIAALILGNKRLALHKKVILVIVLILMFQAMLYSGTRAAFVIFPIGMFMFIILSKNKKMYALAVIGALMMGVIIVMPTSNPTIKRFQSAFQPSDDPSYLVRLENQRRIRPWVWKHPLGGGLGATGIWGQRFAPNAFLSGFPPDSGYVRVAVELGWIGLTIYMLLWITIFIEGIKSYFRIRDPAMKSIALGMICSLFTLYIVNYAQQAVNQVPTSLMFWVMAAIISRGSQLEQASRKLRMEEAGA
jgi:hypothetical protein